MREADSGEGALELVSNTRPEMVLMDVHMPRLDGFFVTRRIREVADRVRQRFGQERIDLMAHSCGTFLGIQTAARAGERFHAYIGVA